jgi:DNA-directed RNA polymerase specialized sigma24 family protein
MALKKSTKRKKKTAKEKKPYYVNAKEFLALLIKYYDDPSDAKVERELGSNICKIATGLSYAPNFINYSYKDDMVGDAVVKMYSALKNKKYNLDSGNNPFSYFTTIAFHAFINRIKKEKKHRDVINEYQEVIYDQLRENDIPIGGNESQSLDYDDS